jgi:23S rRNA-/tRNA-specific pseudouridylate synthase
MIDLQFELPFQHDMLNFVNFSFQPSRTHQLRIHMASIGHPIIGDLFYAPRDVFLENNRLLLHAEELRLTHPRTNQHVRFISPCPFSLYG